MTQLETVRSAPVAEATPEISIAFSPHGSAFSYNVGEEVVSPTDTYFTGINEDITFTATVKYNNPDKQWAIGYEWNFGDGSIGYGNPGVHKYLFVNEIQVSVAITDNKGQIARAGLVVYLK